jgi:Na+:H+ antiporter, NhaA family
MTAGRNLVTPIRSRRLVRALQTFLETEVSGGILLLAAALVALIWANSPFADGYERLWRTELTLRVGPWTLAQDLRHWVNDGLMTLFFFVVGLEIKRELTVGELRDPRAAALPILAAVGGMLFPAALFLAVNPAGEAARGWGIPMATDIAFALGVVALVDRSIPSSLRLFLLALAIVDDIGAIVVIAIFYSDSIDLAALGAALALLSAILVLRHSGVHRIPVYVVLGMATWFAAFQAGIHPTVAGVALGLMTPAVPIQRPARVSEEARRVADETDDNPQPPDADAHHWLYLARLSRETLSPLGRLEHLLHPWTSYVIVPVFALANAGVGLSFEDLQASVGSRVWIGVVVGLVFGKVAGVALGSFLGVRMGIARLPAGATWRHLFGVAALAGIGFTVSLFITSLAFADPLHVAEAKVGILTGSLLAGVVGVTLLRRAR